MSGEESARQIRMRADRLGGEASNCQIYCETSVENIVAEATDIQPDLVIVDSVQTMYSCLLYTSDAADELLCVDLGGRRLIKKKNPFHHLIYTN